MDGLILKILHRRSFKEDASVIDWLKQLMMTKIKTRGQVPLKFQLGENDGKQEEAQIQALIENLLEQFGDKLVAHKGWIKLWLKSGPKESQLYKNLMFVLIK